MVFLCSKFGAGLGPAAVAVTFSSDCCPVWPADSPLGGDVGADHRCGEKRAAQEFIGQPTPQQSGCTAHAAILTGELNSVKIESIFYELIVELGWRALLQAR
jgi:hypothetical protein